MDTLLIALISILALLVLLSLGVPFGFAFGLVGFFGIVFVKGITPALVTVGQVPYRQLASYTLATLPLFILMGQFAFRSGISRDLFRTAYHWMGHLPGGLALATMLACTAFAACTGSSIASAATMSAVAFPEMEKHGYNHRLSTATIAAGGTLGILIPPSTIFIIYGIITETSIGELFIAGVLPGILLSAMFLMLIYVWCLIDSKMGPRGKVSSWIERIKSLKGTWGMLLLFAIVLGGLYAGVFSPSEAGTIGAFGAFILALVRRTPKDAMLKSAKDTILITIYILFILIGAQIFNTYFAVTGVSHSVANWIVNLPVPPMLIVACIIILYIPLGMFLNIFGVILLTVPIFFPIVVEFGFDPVWFGVIICILAELGQISPPVAINVYVVQGMTKVPIQEIYRGITPFIVIMLIFIVLVATFPQISLFLPSSMK